MITIFNNSVHTESRLLIGGICSLMLLPTGTKAQTLVTNVMKREVWVGAFRQQIETNGLPASTNITWLDSWEVPNDGNINYAARMTGQIIPVSSGLYDFYVASDDDASVWLGTSDLASSKYQIAQEDGWSPPLGWNTIGGGGSIVPQKGSLTWTNASGVAPHAGGINLTASTRYYLEVDYHAGPFLPSQCAVTMVPHGGGVADGTSTTLTNGGAAIILVSIPTPIVLTFNSNPTNKTVYPGMTAYFRAAVVHNSQIPPSFQWQRGTVVGGVTNYVDIPKATNASVLTGGSSSSVYSFPVSTNDTDARFRCIARVPGIGPPTTTRTSSPAVLTVPASGGLTVSGRLKRELFANMGATAVDTITNGNNNFASAVNTFLSADVGSAGANYGERLNGFFTPTMSGNYVFFLSADDNAMLFVSTNDQPAGKLLVAQEDGSSDPRDWYGFTSINGSLPTQKRSDFWSPDGGFTIPYATGIPMTAGRRYYIEAVHRGGGGNNHVEITYGTTDEVAIGIPMESDPSRLTNGVISYVTTPTTTFAITNQPSSVTRDEGLPYTFVVGVRTDSEITPSYQWKKNGMNINGATAASYTGIALIGDNGALFSCDISIPGVINTNSSSASLTVIQGVFAEGILKREFWTNATARGITRQLIGANVGGTFPDADYTLYTESLYINEDRANNYVQRVSGFFVAPATADYVFYLACDDDADMYISTDEQPANKYLIAQETGWSSAGQWLSSGGNSSNLAQKRSDQFNGGVYAAGIPLIGGERYYLEIVHHENTGGDAVSATYTFLGELPPTDFTPSRFGGTNIGVPVPPATTLNIDGDPQSTSGFVWQPVYFNVLASSDGIVPPTYQWRRYSGTGFTNVPGAIAEYYGFIVSSNDQGAQFECVVSAPGVPSLTKTSIVASLTVQPGGTFEAGALDQERWNMGVSTTLIEVGGLGPADVLDTVTNIDFGQLGDSFGNRIRGFFIPPVTTNYVFFISSDNNSDLFLSTDDQPSNKRLIAQEQVFSGQNDWTTADSGDPIFKNSSTWTPEPGVIPPPYASGIPLVASQRYYIEIVHSETGGLDALAVTYKMFDEPDPLDGTPSIITSDVLGRMIAPIISQPVLTAMRSGGNLVVSWTPSGGTLESTTDLAPPVNWAPVGTSNPTNLVIGPGNLFLRVTVP